MTKRNKAKIANRDAIIPEIQAGNIIQIDEIPFCTGAEFLSFIAGASKPSVAEIIQIPPVRD